jgi:hypothetical protein
MGCMGVLRREMADGECNGLVLEGFLVETNRRGRFLPEVAFVEQREQPSEFFERKKNKGKGWRWRWEVLGHEMHVVPVVPLWPSHMEWLQLRYRSIEMGFLFDRAAESERYSSS